MEALIAYLQDHPLVALLLLALTIILLGSLVKKLLKLAIFVALALLIGLYLTNEEASEEWRAKSGNWLKKAEATAREYGGQALDKGKEAIEEHLSEGADELVEQVEEGGEAVAEQVEEAVDAAEEKLTESK